MIELPHLIKEYKICKKDNLLQCIDATLHTQVYDKVSIHFYLCNDFSKCHHKFSCTYLFPESFYTCQTCSNIIFGEPLYKISPPARMCKNCNDILTTKIPSNMRIMNGK